jgi:hypothetical protein
MKRVRSIPLWRVASPGEPAGFAPVAGGAKLTRYPLMP